MGSSRSKYTNYWGVANGNDTMLSLFNPTNAAQDILATFYYADGSGKYTLPVHLEPQASTLIDMAMLIMEKKPDADGNVIPSSVQEGSAQFASAKGRQESITLVISGGLYNVANATCGSNCITCCGDSNFGISPNPIICLIGGSSQCGSTAIDCNGSGVSPISWSSSNTAVMTVTSAGVVTGVAVGSATVTANFGNVVINTGSICAPSPSCSYSSPAPQAPANTTPKIRLGASNGPNITNTTQSVVVGQQVVLYADYTLASGNTFSSQSWTIPGTGSTPPTAIANFAVASDSSSGGPVSLTSAQLNAQSITFYWVTPTPTNSPNTVTFTLNYLDNQNINHTATATAKFNVAGPMSVSISTTLGQWQIDNTTGSPRLSFGFPIDPEQGIRFNAQATSPSGYTGTYEWAQLVTTNTHANTSGSTTTSCSTGTGLDTQFPVATGLSTSDSPSTALSSTYSKQTWSLGFTMYFMWRPGLTSDVPVPLGYLAWTAFGDATQSSGTWSVQSDSTASANAFQASASYAAWTNKVLGTSPCQ